MSLKPDGPRAVRPTLTDYPAKDLCTYMCFARHKYILLKSNFIHTTLIIGEMFDFRFCAVPELENSYQVLSKGQLKWRDEDEIIVLTWSLLCGVWFENTYFILAKPKKSKILGCHCLARNVPIKCLHNFRGLPVQSIKWLQQILLIVFVALNILISLFTSNENVISSKSSQGTNNL